MSIAKKALIISGIVISSLILIGSVVSLAVFPISPLIPSLLAVGSFAVGATLLRVCYSAYHHSLDVDHLKKDATENLQLTVDENVKAEIDTLLKNAPTSTTLKEKYKGFHNDGCCYLGGHVIWKGKKNFIAEDVREITPLPEDILYSQKMLNFLRACNKLKDVRLNEETSNLHDIKDGTEKSLFSELKDAQKLFEEICAMLPLQYMEHYKAPMTREMEWKQEHISDTVLRMKAVLWGNENFYRFLFDAIDQFTDNNASYLCPISVKEMKEILQKDDVHIPKEDPDDNAKKNFAKRLFIVRRLDSKNIAYYTDLTTAKKGEKRPYLYVQAASENKHLETNIQGRNEIRNIFDDGTQGPSAGYMSFFPAIIRFQLVCKRKLRGTVDKVVELSNDEDMISGTRYTTNGIEYNEEKIKKDTKNIEENMGDISIVMQKYCQFGCIHDCAHKNSAKGKFNSSRGTPFTWTHVSTSTPRCWLPRGVSNRTQKNLANKLQEMSRIIVEAEYAIFAMEVLLQWTREQKKTPEKRRPFHLHLCLVGLNSYGNNSEIFCNVMKIMASILRNTDVNIYLNAYNGNDVRIWKYAIKCGNIVFNKSNTIDGGEYNDTKHKINK
jgi:hypothetical protein